MKIGYDDRYKVDRKTDCWVWQMAKNSGGYGVAREIGRTVYAHRIIYEEERGPIPEGLTLDHLCRNRSCVNPKHLEPVTQRENNRRGFGASGINFRKTHCCRGHKFDQKNTSFLRGGGRQCLPCRRIQYRKNKSPRKSHKKAT